jgi:acetyl-CoA carboxylase biotin carboxyl carrier protein
VSELTPEDVQEILRLVDDSGFDELELETPRFSLRFRRGEREPTAAPTARGRAAGPAANGLVEVVAPMVGTFYRAPAPEAPPFVEVGSAVDEQTQVCILEVMKLMSSVVAGVRGTIVEICRANGEAVEYGDVLFRIQP